MYIEFTLTLGCKNNCYYCPQKKLQSSYYLQRKPDPAATMSMALYKKIINELPNDMDVCFCGMSEPFLHPECTEMILYAANKNHKIFLCTTMVGLSKKNIKILINKVFSKHLSNSIIIHLPSKRKLEDITVDQEYIEKLQMIAKAKISVEFHHHDKGIHPMVWKKLHELEIIPKYVPVKSRANNLAIKEAPEQKRKLGKLVCRRHNLHGHGVLPDGRVVVCCMDYGMKHVLGDLSHSSYHSIHEGKVNRFIDQSLLDDSADILCRYCHGSESFGIYSKFLNSKFSLSKVLLGLKLLIYNRFFPIYLIYIKLKNLFYLIFGQKSKLIPTKYQSNHWLYTPELKPILPR
jgi:organic radical activating enzyme